MFVVLGALAAKNRPEAMAMLATKLRLRFSVKKNYQMDDRFACLDKPSKREAFPSNLIANLFGFKAHDFFNVDPAVREAPKVGLSSS